MFAKDLITLEAQTQTTQAQEYKESRRKIMEVSLLFHRDFSDSHYQTNLVKWDYS